MPWTGLVKSSPANGLRGRMDRYGSITAGIASYIREAADLDDDIAIFIEGLSFGSKGKGMFNLAELRGVLLSELLRLCDAVYEVPPSTLKQFVAGKGNADKTAMITACVKRYGVEYGTNDEYDAYGLCKLGECYLGLAEPANESQRKAITKVTA
jgi:crossover junction endodeoxyribonuclease RuvC